MAGTTGLEPAASCVTGMQATPPTRLEVQQYQHLQSLTNSGHSGRIGQKQPELAGLCRRSREFSRESSGVSEDHLQPQITLFPANAECLDRLRAAVLAVRNLEAFRQLRVLALHNGSPHELRDFGAWVCDGTQCYRL